MPVPQQKSIRNQAAPRPIQSKKNRQPQTAKAPVSSVEQQKTQPGPTDPVREMSPIEQGEIGKENDLLSFSQDNVLRGIIYSEILGKPKSKRRGG